MCFDISQQDSSAAAIDCFSKRGATFHRDGSECAEFLGGSRRVIHRIPGLLSDVVCAVEAGHNSFQLFRSSSAARVIGAVDDCDISLQASCDFMAAHRNGRLRHNDLAIRAENADRLDPAVEVFCLFGLNCLVIAHLIVIELLLRDLVSRAV